MKILYLEDELAKNIDRILNLFGKILSTKERKTLQELKKEAKELIAKGITVNIENSEVKAVVNQNTILDICSSLPEAVDKATNSYEEYSLFIIDRNLEEENYSLADIQQYLPEFDKNTQIKYLAREGDFLLKILLNKIDCRNHFFFLTANSGDSLKCREEFQEVTMLEQFSSENILEKGSELDTQRLTEIINDIKKGNFRVIMKDIFVIFDTGILSKDVEKEFLKTLNSMQSNNLPTIKDNLARIRRIQEAVYIALSKTHNDIIPVKILEQTKDGISVRKINTHLKGNLDRAHNWQPTTTVYQEQLIANFADCIYSVASDNGSHTPYVKPDYPPTKYTVQAMVYALCDLLLWFKTMVK